MPDPAPHSPPATSERHLRWLIFLVAGAMFMENLDGTIIATALPAMARSFGGSAVELNIGISAYLMALGIFIPASGWIADRFGTRRVFCLAIVLFTLSSMLCGLAQGLTEFVAFRTIQGIAGAMMVPVGRLVVLRHTPAHRMMNAMSTLIWPSLVAPVLGPPLGGFITTHAGWRWIFYLNVPLGAIALIAALRLVPEIRSEERRRFDWPGFILCGAGTFALLSGIERLVARFDLVSGVLTVCGLALIGLSIRHFRRAAQPMLELAAFRIPTFRVAMSSGSLARMAIGSAPFLLPLMFQVGFGFSPELAGLLMLGVFGANLGMKTVTSMILRRFGFKPVLVWNGVLAALALAACALLRADMPFALIIAILMIGGASRSMQFTANGMMTFADVPKPLMSGANSLSSTISQLSMGAGVALGAMAIRLGAVVSNGLGLHVQAAEYRVAFVLVAIVGLAGVSGSLMLPRDAGRRFTRTQEA